MQRYVCIKCNSVWHTSNTNPGLICEYCGGSLITQEKENKNLIEKGLK